MSDRHRFCHAALAGVRACLAVLLGAEGAAAQAACVACAAGVYGLMACGPGVGVAHAAVGWLRGWASGVLRRKGGAQ